MTMHNEDWVVVLRVNTHCTLKCLYCGYSTEVPRDRRALSMQRLLNLGRSLQDFQCSGNRRVLVSWLGGEPFLWREWESVCREYRERGLRLSMTTHGLPLQDEETQKNALELLDEITLSMDGLAKHHDALRQQDGLFDALQTIVGQLVRRRRQGIPLLRVNSVLTRSNLQDYREFALTMARWGIDELTFNQLGGNDRPEFYPSQRLESEPFAQWTARLPALKDELRQLGTRLRGSDAYLHRIQSTTRGQSLPVEDCRPATRFLFVDEHGRASPCSFTSESLGVAIETLDSGKAIEALSSTWRHARAMQRPLACQDCHATHVYEKFDT
jgi:AdoMet-dependent heme synthase